MHRSQLLGYSPMRRTSRQAHQGIYYNLMGASRARQTLFATFTYHTVHNRD